MRGRLLPSRAASGAGSLLRMYPHRMYPTVTQFETRHQELERRFPIHEAHRDRPAPAPGNAPRAMPRVARLFRRRLAASA